MTRKETNRQITRISAIVAVFALVLVGFALSSSDVSADGSDYQIIVNGTTETNTVEAVIESATDVVTIELTSDISVGPLEVPNGAEVTIDGKGHTMGLSAYSVTGKIHFINVTMVATEEEGILFGYEGTDEITLTNVVVKDKTVFYDGKFETKNCTFEKRLQLQAYENLRCNIQDTDIEDLQLNSQEVELVISGTEGQNANVVLGGSSTLNKITACEDAKKTTMDNLDVQITELLIKSGAELVIGQDSTIETTGESQNNGTITNNGALVVKGTFTNSGTYTPEVGSKTIQASGANITGMPDDVSITTGESESTDSLGLKNYLDNNQIISTKAFLAGDLTVREGVTLTITSTGSLDLNNFRLILEGNLVVANGGSISAANITTPTSNSIQIMKTGTITNDGIIGKGNVAVAVTVGNDGNYDGIGSVQMMNVTGVSFGLTKVVGDGVDYVLTVSGTVYKKYTDHELTIDGAYISDLNIRDVTTATVTDSAVVKNSTFDIGSKAEVEVNNLTLRTGATLDIDGKLEGNTVSMENGAVAIIDGGASGVGFSAKTGEYPTYTGDKRTDADTYLAESISEVILTNLSGISVEVTSKAFTKNNEAWTEQMLNVYGTASSSDPTTTGGPITITGNIYVPAGKELTLTKDGMTVGGDGTFITEGTIKAIEDISSYKGTSYSLEDTGTETTYNYYTTFDNAYAAIADAEDKTITVMGGYTFEKEYLIDAEQQIVLIFGSYKISDGGKITISNEGTLTIGDTSSGENQITLEIEGVLVVMSEGSRNGEIAYQVESTDAEGTVTYSGAVWAIENASEGSTVNIVDHVTFNKKVTVPSGVTVKVNPGVTIAASKGIVVNGTILNEGTIKVAADQALEVAGKIDNTAGTITCTTTQDSYKATVTGTVEGKLKDAEINAAFYVTETIIYTSVSNAVAAVSEMDIPVVIEASGKFTEASDITLGEGMELLISGEVTLNSVRLSIDSTLTVEGKLTADVIGAVGKADTTGAVSDAIIDLSKAGGVAFELNYNESNATSTLTLTVNGDYAGAVKVEKGTVAVNTEGMELSVPVATFAIGSDATVDLNTSFTITNKDKAFINEGTLNINEDVTFAGVLGGDVVVKAGNTITLGTAGSVPTIVVGTITLSEENGISGSAMIVGEVLIGTAPETLGASGAVSGEISFSSGTEENPVESYVIVFEGSTFASTEDDVKSTSYTVNGIAFAKIYTDNGSVTIDAIEEYISGLDDLKTEDDNGNPIEIKWVSNGVVVEGSTPVISAGAVETYIGYRSATVLVSEGPGLQVYIDDIRTDGSEKLAIGTHTITVYLLPNYEGTPVITINGTTITDGTFEITTDMIGGQNKIVVTGATYVEPSTPSIVIPSQPAENNDDMGLTEYLLIVLVILAAILVVVVAIRMTRS